DNLGDQPASENCIRLGVTTVVAANCGGSALDVGDSRERIGERGADVNFATLIGHNTVRRAVMGTERRAPTAEELSKMKALVTRAMAEGAVGFSTGLQYIPGAYAELPEIVSLASAAAAAGGLYATHMRNEGTAIDAAID